MESRSTDDRSVVQEVALGRSADVQSMLVFATDLAELDRYGGDWDRLADQSHTYFPRFADARSELAGMPFVAAIQETDCGTQGLACFVNQPVRDRFALGERHLFSLPAQETRLLGGCSLGEISPAFLQTILRRAHRERPCDMLTLGEVEQHSPLIAASRAIPGMAAIRRTRSDPIRWLIPCPPTFEEHLASLRPTTRKAIAYETRRFARDCGFDHEVVTAPKQVERFLREAEAIARRTYQWDVGDRLLNDDATRERYCQLAEQGRLRCHLLRVAGEPVAYARGEICGRVFHYETPGFAPRWRRYSPGIVLLALTIRDLIENSDCAMFDFGSGGDTDGYKARFGTYAIPCISLQFANLRRPRAWLIIAAHAFLATAKDAAHALLGGGRLRQRLKRAIRRYDSGAERAGP